MNNTETKQLVTTHKDIPIYVDTDGKFSATPFGKRKAREADTLREIRIEINEADTTRFVRKDVNHSLRAFNHKTQSVETITYIGTRSKDTAKFNEGHNFKVNGEMVVPSHVAVVKDSALPTDIQSLETAARVLRKATETFTEKLKAVTHTFRLPYFSSYSMTPQKASIAQDALVIQLRDVAKK